jgi:hypothetical protein
MTMKRAIGIAILAALAAVGCAAELKNVTAGHIGCSPHEIEIEDDEPGLMSRSWVATCHGRRYQCSGTGGTMSCAELRAER